jgi:hypothetical protein
VLEGGEGELLGEAVEVALLEGGGVCEGQLMEALACRRVSTESTGQLIE